MYKNKQYSKQRTPDPKQPTYIGSAPKSILKTGEKDKVLYVAGEGKPDADVMFITTSLLEEEGRTQAESVTGRMIKQEAKYLKSQTGSVFKDIALSAGIDLNNCYFTAWCKWLVPKNNRTRPTKEQMAWGRPAMLNEIKKVKPRIIVCLGKKVFDELVDIKINAKDARGGWFLHKESGARVYLMDNIILPVFKPEYIEKFRVDLKAICRMDMELDGVEVKTHPTNYRTITTREELLEIVRVWMMEDRRVFSVDCEWHGSNHVDGQLRSIQFCWTAGEAIYIRFMDDALNYVFDIPYAEVGQILGVHLNKPDVQYIGHHFAADAPWMYTWLGLEWYDKCVFDSEFAQQTANEYEDLGLERIAMKYTDLGRYDLDLTLWKKQSKGATKNGYGLVPDEILIPYACKDVDTVMRAYPQILKKLGQQGLLPYYFNIFNPFTTNMFVNFALLGLPMDEVRMDELRDLYSYARDRLQIRLRESIAIEAYGLLMRKLYELKLGDNTCEPVADLCKAIDQEVRAGNSAHAWSVLKGYVGVENVGKIKDTFEHYVESPNFNLRSPNQMKRWLYSVKGYTPIKSTSNKEKGLPSMDWERVLQLPAAAQKEYNPSTDIQSLEILHELHGDKMMAQLLRLNAVGNITKQFLKDPITDEDGNITEEKGLHESLCSDHRVHGQMSTTETGRPRSWNPNILNWPSWVNDKIADGIIEALEDAEKAGELPERFKHYLDDKPPSIRSCVRAPEGWCFVESDYQTAEIRGLAFISGDKNLISIMTEPDEQYKKVIDTTTKEDTYVRVSFDTTLNIGDEYNHILRPAAEFALDENGNTISPKADLHWSLAEMVTRKPRELLNKDVERKGLGKVGNFSSAYGASPVTLERKIEQDTRVKPEEGTGQAVLDALRKRQPVAVGFLEDMEDVPKEKGKYQAASGRIRHCPLGQTQGREAQRILAALGREMRNFPMQESVAATAARAANWLLTYFREHDMLARPLIILYDSVVTLCPLEEAEEVAKLHQRFMCDENTWTYHKRVMNYPIDTDFLVRWSTSPKGEEVNYLFDAKLPVDEKLLLDRGLLMS